MLFPPLFSLFDQDKDEDEYLGQDLYQRQYQTEWHSTTEQWYLMFKLINLIVFTRHNKAVQLLTVCLLINYDTQSWIQTHR